MPGIAVEFIVVTGVLAVTLLVERLLAGRRLSSYTTIAGITLAFWGREVRGSPEVADGRPDHDLGKALRHFAGRGLGHRAGGASTEELSATADSLNTIARSLTTGLDAAAGSLRSLEQINGVVQNSSLQIVETLRGLPVSSRSSTTSPTG